MPTCNSVSTQAKMASKVLGGRIHAFAADEKCGFRSTATKPSHMRSLTTVQCDQNGKPMYSILKSNIFGNKHSVRGFARKSEFASKFLRMLGIPADRYVDDHWVIELDITIDSAYECFHCVLRCMGYVFERSKDQPPGPELTLVGVWFDLATFHKAIQDVKRKQRISEITKYLVDNWLDSIEAERVAGRISWFCPILQSVDMKIYVAAMKDRQYRRDLVSDEENDWRLSYESCEALHMIRTVLEHAKPYYLLGVSCGTLVSRIVRCLLPKFPEQKFCDGILATTTLSSLSYMAYWRLCIRFVAL